MKFKLADPYYAASDCNRYTIVLPHGDYPHHTAYRRGQPTAERLHAGTKAECKAACERAAQSEAGANVAA